MGLGTALPIPSRFFVEGLRMTETTPLRSEDVLPVRSRISWGAIFAGLFTALAISVLLSVLGTALGLTWSEHASRSDYVSSGAAIWAAITGLVALFCGGLGTSMFTAGGNKGAAGVLGGRPWGAVLFPPPPPPPSP